MTVDTSVVVAGFSPWHERHDDCRAVIEGRPEIVGHALVESFSVLTRLPAPFRIPAPLAVELLQANFARPPLTMSSEQMAQFVDSLTRWRVTGGAVYDALIAATARDASATLLTLDVRAVRTYLAVGADARLV